MNARSLINSSLKKYSNPQYLEIGVRNGETFFSIKTKKKYGIDPNFFFSKRFLLKSLLKTYNWGYKMFKEESDTFFNNRAAQIKNFRISVAFIDGLHTYEQSFSDAINCLNWLEPNGIIIFHDSNPQSEEAASVQLPSKPINWNGDVWKTIKHFRGLSDYFECYTFDADQGLSVLTMKKKINPKTQSFLKPDKEISRLPYQFLNDNRKEILGLTNPYDYTI